MAYRIKDRNGDCCGCSERSDPCTCGSCFGPLPATGFECRSRGGVASLVGFAEICNASTPPKRFRVATYSGSNELRGYLTSACSGAPNSTASITFSGVKSYSAEGLLTVTAREVTRSPIGGAILSDVVPADPPSGMACGIAAGCESDFLYGQLAFSIIGNVNCCSVLGAWRTASGTRSVSLSSEDREADAINRLLAGAGGEWGSSGTGGCVATWADRGAGVSFLYVEAQWRANVTGGLPPGQVCAYVTYQRRPAGSLAGEPWVDFGEGFVKFTVGTSGGGTSAWATIPNDLGWETRATDFRLVCATDGECA